ncbi:hypothetical protein BLS_008223 [Venturia inaequalis]|uniref:RRM domain-containing protein n=1 Tax=Venturia inaequalis TaxID=5025 RepID=A0A8H3YL17_VENIN|nr:hypothetical protein BLS_008223 [Venturia inaequalis]
MDQIITTLRIQEGSSVTIMDRRRIWWNGLVECPDGYKYTSPLGTAGMVPPADGSHGTRYDPSRRSFTIVLIPREFSPPKSKQEAGPSERAEEPETNGESRHESRTPTGPHRAPSNLDPHSGNYRAFVKFMDGKKLSEVKLREHLETFGPLGPYLKPSSVNNRNHSAFVEFKTYAGFKAAEAAGLHTLGDVELWVQERDDRESLRNTTRSGSGNGPAMPPPAPGSANRGGRAAGQSLPTPVTPAPTARPPLSTEEQPSTDFVIPRRGERRGVDIMTPQGKKKVFKKGGAAGKGEGLGGRTFWDEEGRGAGDGGGKDGGGEGGGGMAA